ncbi:hypothetical protein SmJEL517_g02965 [Synchytrium microbalum]|uniref:UDP-N-acetylglucosamine transferase subunit ALG14 n=1 Tax=Synchytrium microbalum TaxID=1806994 RepID=A0A507C8M3_9FUNG|nr:uncharacterized protein SmJEL517_g02965 [Synchytrium microbalum]TPX34346.1 hypothetical protein SmJEL517_g02965 [Synchytrium microbalum]
MNTILQLAATLVIVIIARLLILFYLPHSPSPKSRTQAAKTCIVMGSGGHTGEMTRLLTHLPSHQFYPRCYLIASTDTISGSKAKELEREVLSGGEGRDFRIVYIPRSREVGQSWISTVGSTVGALVACGLRFWDVWPDVIVCNGPGTCIPIILVAHFFKILGLKQTAVIFIESFARVESLSLTGRILYVTRMANKFVVQWPELQERYPRSLYSGRLV